jgi:DNA modification methylase
MPLELNRIHHGDARDLLRRVQHDSIACSVWSPPYHVGKTYEKGKSFEEWNELLEEVIALHFPILRPGGFLAVNIADILCFPDPQMPRIQAQTVSRHRCTVTRDDIVNALKEYPDYNRYQLAELLGCSEQTIQRRLEGNNVRGGKYATQTRVKLVGAIVERAAHEAGLYLYDHRVWVKDPAWMNSKWHTLSYRSVDEFEYIYIFWKPGETLVDRKRLTSEEWRDWGSRAVWHFPSVRANSDHEAKFPVELPSRVIRLLTSPGDTVLDCFMGSGTTAVAAIRLSRNFIGIELIEEYVRLATEACQKEWRSQRAHQTEMPFMSETA